MLLGRGKVVFAVGNVGLALFTSRVDERICERLERLTTGILEAMNVKAMVESSMITKTTYRTYVSHTYPNQVYRN